MKISSKDKANALICEFSKFAKWDVQGNKHYIVFVDKKTNDTVTLMKYNSGALATHRKNEIWSDDKEKTISFEKCVDLIWTSRASINRILKDSI